MNNEQKFTPKYWVCHDLDGDDILTETMSKSQDQTYLKAKALLGGEALDRENIQIVLIEIRLLGD